MVARDCDRGARSLNAAFVGQQLTHRRFVACRLPTAATRVKREVHPRIPSRVKERSEASKDVWNRCFFYPSVLQAASPTWLLDPQLVTQPLLQQDWTSVAKMRLLLVAAAISSRAAALDAVRHRIAAPGIAAPTLPTRRALLGAAAAAAASRALPASAAGTLVTL